MSAIRSFSSARSVTRPANGQYVLRATSPKMRTPYAQSFSLDVQRELPWRMVAAVGYYGNIGIHLIGIVDLNQPTPGQLVINNGVPANCLIAVAPCTTAASPHINAIRPYRGYGPINMIISDFTSNYNSLQVKFDPGGPFQRLPAHGPGRDGLAYEQVVRVRGVGEKTIEQLKRAGYPTVEVTDARYPYAAPLQIVYE